MKNALKRFFLVYFGAVVLFMFQRTLFVCIYGSQAGSDFSGLVSAMCHGIPMDLATAAYITVIPGLLCTLALCVSRTWIDTVWKVYFGFVALLLSLIFCMDIALYAYWGFRLDSTPLFYFSTSPSAAMASMEWWQMIAGFLVFALIAAGIYLLAVRGILRYSIPVAAMRVRAAAAMLFLTVALFLPMRGSLTVSTMNISRAYFSDNQRLNHIAVNPAFSLLYSLSHQTDFASQYRFMDDSLVRGLMAEMTDNAPVDSTVMILNTTRPNIVLVILESFSAHLMPSLGGEPVATGLDSLAREGVLFSNFYANSFRTDRALPSVISAFPAMPSASLLKYVRKTEHLPSLPAELKKAGYGLSYYYGGDANYVNLQAYLRNCGFDRIVSDKDFDIKDKTGKWGAHDHLVFARALEDIRNNDGRPSFSVIQTSSSHEPFDVPYNDPRFASHKQKNAFAYTDRTLFQFVDDLRKTPAYDNTLIIIVPDHYGVYPEGLDDVRERHHVPLVLLGGAVSGTPRVIDTPGSQIDIAATVLAQLGLDSGSMPFSKNMLNPLSPHFAFFTEPALAAMTDDKGGYYLFNCDADRTLTDIAGGRNLEEYTKAYLQSVYDYIAKL